MSRRNAIILMILASVCWSFGGLWIKEITWNPLVIAGARSLISGTFMLFFLKKSDITFSKNIWLGGFCYVFVAALFVISNKLTTSTNAILLQFTAPIWTIIFGAFFWQEKVNKKDIAVVAIVIFGMLLFFVDDLQVGNMLGNLFAIGAGIAVALMIRVMQSDKKLNPLLMTIIGNYFLFLASLPFFFIYPPELSAQNLITILKLGVLQLGLGYILFTYAIHHVSALDAALLLGVEPLLNPLWVFLVLGEKPTLYSFIGAIIVLVSIIGYQIDAAKTMKES